MSSLLTKKALPVAFYLLNISFIFFFWWSGSGQLFQNGLSSSLLALARLSGLLGMFSLLTQFTLISRGKWLESRFGLDKLTRIHHWNGLLAISFIIVHILLVTRSYSWIANVTFAEQDLTFLRSFPYVWLAGVGFALLLTTVGISLTIVRRKLRYETWYYVHLFNYIVLLSVFWHQLANGGDLLVNNLFRGYWISLYVLVLANLFIFRFIRPALLYKRHHFSVERVVAETSYTNSVYIKGKTLERFSYIGGQFAKWWFIAPGFWKEEHPFTISIEPNGQYLRLTPKTVGDFTSRIKDLKPGTPVVVDGAYGIFTPKVANSNKFLFIAGGIGITPIRAMIGELTSNLFARTVLANGINMVLLYSAKVEADFTFKKELEALAKKGNLKIHYILAEERRAGYLSGRLDGAAIKKLVPDFLQRDVYICGPPPMMEALSIGLRSLGMPKARIHIERFSL